MKTRKLFGAALIFICAAAVVFTGCSNTPKSPEVADAIRHSLDQSGFKDISVSQDRDKGVVTLTGHVPADGDKATAEAIARGLAGGQVVADQIQVLPPGNESAAKDVSKDLDDAIKSNLDAVFIQGALHKQVSYEVKAGVVTLTGTVDSQARRAEAARLAQSVPNVTQVVNELEIKGQKATSLPAR